MSSVRHTVCIAFSLAVCLNLSAQLVTVNWGAQNSSGLGTANGTELSIGSLVRIGAFDLPDSEILQNQENVGLLNSHFVEFGHAAIGDDVGVGGHWNTVSIASADGLGVSNRRIYLWAFDSPSLATATQQGIFNSSNPAWVFPADAAVPNTATIDLEQILSSEILVGGFGAGTSSATGAKLYNLTDIPEPEAFASILALLCLCGAVGRECVRRCLRCTASPHSKALRATPAPPRTQLGS